MKTAYLFFVIFSFSVLNFAQVDTPKQLTNFDFDSRNPAFLQYPENTPWYPNDPELFFEAAYNDSFKTICSMKYNIETDSFYQLKQISFSENSDSNFICRNVAGKSIDYYDEPPYNFAKILVWETNINGNWDIAFSVDSGGGWTTSGLLISSQEDELYPSFITGEFWIYPTPPLQMLYSCGNSILLHNFNEGGVDEVLFEGNDTTKYSEPTGAYWQDKFYVAAVQQTDSLEPHIVYRSKSLEDTSWSRIQPVYNRAATTSPKFTNPNFGIMLSFQVLFGRKKKILLMRPEDFGTTGAAVPLLEDPTIETSDFSAFTYNIITTSPQDDYSIYYPFTFVYKKDDSTFVRIGRSSGYDSFTDYYTKVNPPNPSLGSLGIVTDGFLSYTIWEDSSDSRINLFGLKRFDPLGAVDDPHALVKDFVLFQNYPNPFNPITKISWQSSIGSWQTLKVYDILGNEVAILVNEYKPAGSYQVEFNTESDTGELASGIYFYQLKAGNYIETKKMILMK